MQKELPRILLVEDEESLITGLTYNLSEEGYSVTVARDGREAIRMFQQHDFDLIILDIMLPYKDGFEVAKIIRKNSPFIPILMLTARTAVEDRVTGFDIGADDYITKPFHLRELLARIRRVLERSKSLLEKGASDSIYKFGPNTINFNSLKASTPSGEINLTPHETDLMRYLVENRGKVVSRQELLEKVWKTSSEIETRTIDIFIARLRKYFEKNPGKPVFIRSRRGAGYIFIDDSNDQ